MRAVRGSSWLTAARIERWSFVFLAGYLVFFLGLILTAHGLNDLAGRPLGADFSSFYSAGQLARQGQSPYDQVLLHGVQQSLFGPNTPYFGFAYPPLFLLLLAPLSLLAYPFALGLWQIGTLAFYAFAMEQLRRALAPRLPWRPYLLAGLAFTAVFVNLSCGQNGLLTASLFALALAFLDSRPLLAGLCFALLAYKPQLGLLIPFALAASGRWRVFLAAGLCVLVLGGLSTVLFGAGLWHDWLAAGDYSRRVILDQGLVGYGKMVSIFAALRLLHVPLAAAYGAQALAALAAVIAIIAIWRARGDVRLKGAALCLATFLVTPFALDYDMVLLAPGIALIAAHGSDNGLAPFEGLVLALLWTVPILSRAGGMIHIPAAIFLMVAQFLIVHRRRQNCTT